MADNEKKMDTEQDAQGNGQNPDEQRPDVKSEKGKRQSLKRIMTFSQYMREENEEDIELITRVREQIQVPDGWKEDDHRDDFRPSYWFTKDNYIIELYATMGAVAIMLGEFNKGLEPVSGSDKDFTMINPHFPPLELPVWDEEEDEENLEITSNKFTWYVKQCEEYIAELKKAKEEKAKVDNDNNGIPFMAPLIPSAPIAKFSDPIEKIAAAAMAARTNNEKDVPNSSGKDDYKSRVMKRFGKAFFKRNEG